MSAPALLRTGARSRRGARAPEGSGQRPVLRHVSDERAAMLCHLAVPRICEATSRTCATDPERSAALCCERSGPS
jgi:hypothetical protein